MKKRTAQLTKPLLKEISLQRLKPLLADSDYEELLTELAQPLRPAFRINPLKINNSTLDILKKRYGWQLEQIPFCPSGFQLLSGNAQISKTLEYRMGQLYIQDAASMFPVELLDLSNVTHPLILDIAASPGGKTTHLISRTMDEGLVIANDFSSERIHALRLNIQTWGAIRQAVTCLPGIFFGQYYPNTFDFVLLDAPCSMEGLRSSENHPLRPITDRERIQLARRQHNLLVSAIRSTKPGGQIVYSTCTLAPEENEMVLQAVLDELPGQFSIDPLELPSGYLAPALKMFKDNTFSQDITHAFRLWPHIFHTAGFFSARLTKLLLSERLVSPEVMHFHDQLRGQKLGSQDVNKIIAFLQSQYGFDLNTLPMWEESELWLIRDIVHIVPTGVLEILRDIVPVSMGLSLGQLSPDGFLLNHDFVSRFHSQFVSGKFVLPADLQDAWLRGEDLRDLKLPLPVRMIAVIVDQEGRFLGCGKVLNDRLRNLLPKKVTL